MKVETKFVRNYLSKPRFAKGLESVVVVLGLCLLASWFYWNPVYSFSSSLAASTNSVFVKGEYWRLFTTSFVHADLKHLLSNSMMLGLLTYFVSSFYGVFVSVGLSFIVAIFTNYLVIKLFDGQMSLVGASGVLYYLWGFWMILYMFLQRQYSFINRSLRMGTVFLILLIPTEYQPSTSYLAHYIGFALGLVTGSFYYFFNRVKLKEFEIWSTRVVSEELTDLDIIALTHPDESETTENHLF